MGEGCGGGSGDGGAGPPGARCSQEGGSLEQLGAYLEAEAGDFLARKTLQEEAPDHPNYTWPNVLRGVFRRPVRARANTRTDARTNGRTHARAHMH